MRFLLVFFLSFFVVTAAYSQQTAISLKGNNGSWIWDLECLSTGAWIRRLEL